MSCFVAGTKVSTKDGLKNIEEVKASDYVLSWDEKTGNKEYKKVLRTFINKKQGLVKTTIGTEVITSTTEHPYWIEGTGWVAARELKAGMQVTLADGRKAAVVKVEQIPTKTAVTVYNFEVDGWHSYFVGEEQVLVHNQSSFYEKPTIQGSQASLGDGANLSKDLKKDIGYTGVALTLVGWYNGKDYRAEQEALSGAGKGAGVSKNLFTAADKGVGQFAWDYFMNMDLLPYLGGPLLAPGIGTGQKFAGYYNDAAGSFGWDKVKTDFTVRDAITAGNRMVTPAPVTGPSGESQGVIYDGFVPFYDPTPLPDNSPLYYLGQ
jgi:hypothetical protein